MGKRSMHVIALIPAAGRGRRMGGEQPKAFLPLAGIPLLVHTLRRFEACPQVQEVLPIVPEEWKIDCEQEILRPFGFKKVPQVLAGGVARQDSVYEGLKAIEGRAEWVIIHDGARPFVPAELINRILKEGRRRGAVAAALPASDTVKAVSSTQEVQQTLDRSRLWIAQTPQFFAYPLIWSAHKAARRDGFYGTDDASLVERQGVPVRLVKGSGFNLKITTPEDLMMAEGLLRIFQEKGFGGKGLNFI
jgi:2-C-methyl-D-erythritol 4-phosphate cytidylyltransferase